MNLEKVCRPSPEQVEYLVSFLEKNQSVARGFPKQLSQKEKVRRTWQKLALRLNNIEGGGRKSWKQWTKYWSDKRNSTKKKALLQNQNRSNGVQDELELTEIEERIIILLGGEKLLANKTNTGLNTFQESYTSQEETNPKIKERKTENEQDNSDLFFGMLKEDPDEMEQAEYLYDENLKQSESAQETRFMSPRSSPPREASPALRRSSRKRTAKKPPQKTSTPRRNCHIQKCMSPTQRSRYELMERLLKIKEERLEIDRRNSQLLETFLKLEAERDRAVTQALQIAAEGLRVLAEVIKNKSNHKF